MSLRHALPFVLAASAFGQVTVQVSPAASVLPAGKQLAFTVGVKGTGQQGCAWSLPDGEGELSPEGVFTAPVLAESKVLRIRATSTAEPGSWGEASVLVLRSEQGLSCTWDLVAKTQGPQAWRPFTTDGKPFLDVETGLRYDPRAEVAPTPCRAPAQSSQWVGYGLPVPIHWHQALAGADGLLLSVREGGEVLRFNVTGQPSQVVQARGWIQEAGLEILHRRDGARWESQTLPLKVQVRGVVPFAGNPAAGPGHEDGPGLQARFRKPWGLALLGSPRTGDCACVVADAEDHAIRMVAQDGGTRTLCGGPGSPGFQDGPGSEARFNGPTFLAARPAGVDPETFTRSFVVADTGNHAIRSVDDAGAVTTLAGGGVSGYVDAKDPRLARFDRPLGVAVDSDRNVFVADAGNHAIRRIDARGRVTTLAGTGRPGYRDGEGSQAQFSDLKGLALVNGVLCVVDGHCLRTISCHPGWHQVETLLGRPGEPSTEVGGVLELDRTFGPALNRPCGIAASKGKLLVADEGNHGVRAIGLDPLYLEYQCSTLAGEPQDGTLRWGLLRDGLPWRPGPAYGALEAPRDVLFTGTGGAYVSTGSCLVHLAGSEAVPPTQRLRDERDHGEGEASVARMWQPYRLRVFGPWHQVLGGRPHRLRLECLDRDTGGTYAEPVEYGALEPEPTVVFSRPGRVETRLTVLTESGFTQGFRKHFKVVSE